MLDSEDDALTACRLVLARQDFAQLAAATSGGSREPYLQAERDLAEALEPDLCQSGCIETWATLTVLAFLP